MISVILPTYNRCHLVVRAIQSVLIQEGINWELIIVDDGSTDETKVKVKSFLQNSKVRYVLKTHGGVSKARNEGIRQAKGEWVCFLDSDDEWKKNKLLLQYTHIHQTKLLWNQTEEIWIRNGVRVNQPKYTLKKEGDIFESSLERCMVTPSSVLIQKKMLETMGGFNEDFITCEDYELWLKIACQYPIGLVKKPLLIRYGGHNDQLSFQYPAMDRFRIQAIDLCIRSKILTQKQEELSLRVLKKKLQIYLQGCQKRKKYDEIGKWQKDYACYL